MAIFGAISGAVVGNKIAGAAVAALVLGAAAGGVAIASSRDDGRATVVRVVDGDTLVALVGGSEETVRLLNIDTPETKDPNEPVQCLGPEATSYLNERLPVGTAITLEYDQERTDRYGRTLAGVFESGSLVNADIAAQGLGVAVVFEPNRKFYADVLRAQESARQRLDGFYDPAVPCTLPGQVAGALAPIEALAAEAPATAATAGASAATAVAALTAAEVLHHSVRSASHFGGAVLGAAYTPAETAAQTGLLTVGIGAAKAELKRLEAAASSLKAAEARAAAEIERKQKAAQQRAAAERAAKKAALARKAAAELAAKKAVAEEAARTAANQEAAAAREASLLAATQEAKRQAAAEAARKAARPRTAPPVKRPAYNPPAASNPYPGYTGPRCYAPGGRSWKPCK